MRLTIADAQQKKMLLKRDRYPEDLLGTVLFVASSDSDFLTGQTINVDGGTWML